MSVFEFGGTRYIDPGISGIALVSTVVFLAVCDFSTHCLEKFLGHSTIYMSMLRKIYKELMIMGIVSFCLVMYQAAHPNTSNEVHLWISTFDYVGFVLFFNAIYTVIHALSIIVWSLKTSEEYNRFHSISITDVSLKIEKLKQNWFLRKLYELNYYPFLSTRQIAEFKVIHVLFRNTFGVPIDFNFGEYLGKCFERYSLNILNLSVASWIVMFVLYGINMIRIYTPYPNNSFKCGEKLEQEDQGHEDQGGGGHRMLSSTTSIIENMVNMMWNMFLFNIINVDDNVGDNIDNNNNNIDNNNENNNIDINGDDNGNDHDDHDDHDMKNEDSSESINNCDLSYVRLFVLCSSILEFYVLLVFMMGRVYTLRLLRKAGVDSITKVTDDLVYFLDEEAAREHIYHNKIVASEKSSHGRRMSIKTFSKFIEKAKDVKSKKNTPEGNNQTNVAPVRHLRGNRPSKFHLVSNYEPTQTSSILSQKENLFTITRKLEAQRKKSVELRHRGRHNELKLAEDFSDIYAFQSPTLYFRAVELGIVLNCIYLSLWVGDFIFIANQLGESSSFYQLLMAIPCVFLIPLLTQTVKTASLLAAIAALDVDVIAEVLEESEERTYLIEELRSKIIQRTASRGLQKRELLESVFKEIDTDGSGEINRSELRSVLVKLDMGYSGKKFNRLYTAIDRNGDGSLSITELNHLLFPEDAQQKEVEELGAKVQSRIDRRITALETEQRSESSNVPLRAHQKRSEQINSLKTLSISGRKLSGNIPEETSPSPEVLPPNSSDIINCPKLIESPSAIIARSISKLKERNLISLPKDKKDVKNDDSDSNSSSNSVSSSSSNKEESTIDKDKIPNSSYNLQDNISVTSPKPVAVTESKLDNFQNEIDHVHTSMSMTDPISTLLPSSLSISEKEPMVDQPIPNEQNEINQQYSNMNSIKLPPVISHKQDAIQNHKKKIKPEYQIQTNYPPNFIVDNQQSSPQYSNYQNFKSFSTDGYNPQFHPQNHPLISPMNQNIPDQSHFLMERVRRHLRETQGHSQRRIEPININTNDNNENNDWEYSKVNNNEKNENKRNNDKSKVKSKTNSKNFQKQGSGSFSFPHFPSDQFDGKYIDNKTSDIGYGRNDTINDTRVDIDQEIAEDKHSSISHNHSKDVLRNRSDGYLKSSTSTSAFTSSSIHRNTRKYKHEEQDKNRNRDNEDQFQHLNRNFNPNHQSNNHNHSNNSNNNSNNQQRNNHQQYQYHHHHDHHDSNYQHRINDMYVDEESGNLYYDNHHHQHNRNNNYHNRNYHNNNNNFNYHHNSHNSHNNINSHNNSNIHMSSNTNIDDRRDNDRIGSWEMGYERVEYDNDNENYNGNDNGNDNDNRDEMLQRHNKDLESNNFNENVNFHDNDTVTGRYGYGGYHTEPSYNNFDKISEDIYYQQQYRQNYQSHPGERNENRSQYKHDLNTHYSQNMVINRDQGNRNRHYSRSNSSVKI